MGCAFRLCRGGLLCVVCGALLCGQSSPPTNAEIEQAYRARSAEFASIIPRLSIERWRVREVRGWKLKFKRFSQESGPGMTTRRYVATARHADLCSEYQITDRIPHPQARVNVRPSVEVKAGNVAKCR